MYVRVCCDICGGVDAQGLPCIDLDDLEKNTEYNGYSRSSPNIVWFWQTLHELSEQDLAKFLQFATGTSKVRLTIRCNPCVNFLHFCRPL